MALHRDFVNKLYDLKKASVREVLGKEGLGMFIWADGECKQNLSSIKDLENIIETVDFLLDEGYVEQTSYDNHPIPNLIFGQKHSEDKKAHVEWIQDLLTEYYNKRLKVKISLGGYINDNYKTNTQRKEARRVLLDIGVLIAYAVLACVAVWSADYTSHTNEILNRPYITIDGTGKAYGQDEVLFDLSFVNRGKLPARITSVSTESEGFPSVVNSSDIILGPGENKTQTNLGFKKEGGFLNYTFDFVIRVVYYQLLDRQEHNKYCIEYQYTHDPNNTGGLTIKKVLSCE